VDEVEIETEDEIVGSNTQKNSPAKCGAVFLFASYTRSQLLFFCFIVTL
jgi:hypothetical protein